jgi:hypothetical protein
MSFQVFVLLRFFAGEPVSTPPEKYAVGPLRLLDRKG